METDYIQLDWKENALAIDCGNENTIQANIAGLECEWDDILVTQVSDIRLDVRNLKTGGDDSIGHTLRLFI